MAAKEVGNHLPQVSFLLSLIFTFIFIFHFHFSLNFCNIELIFI
jgi:hypothetical protein